MSFFFGGGGKQVKPEYTGIQMQTASSVLALTIAWGANRFAPNLIWYNDFTAHKVKQKAGKGGGSVDSYTYSASVILALCEGQITGIGRFWKDQETVADFGTSGFTLFTGAIPQAPWGYIVSRHPTEARDYPGVAYLAQANYDLGSSASLPNHSFEVKSRQYQTSKDGSEDADPSIVIDEYLTYAMFGCGVAADNIDYTTLYSSGSAMSTGDATFQTYCAAQGFGLSPILSDPTAATDTLDRWTKICNTAVIWTGYKLAFIPYDLADIDGNGYKYRPDRTIQYNLTDDDYVSNNEDPVQVSRVDPADADNALKVIIANRANEYNDAPAEWRDQGLIDQYTYRPASNFDAKEITRLDMGMKVAALMGQRDAYLRNSYVTTLGPEYVLLEPMDLVTLTDPKFGTIEVRLTDVEEDEDGNFKITAEEVAIEVSSSNGNPSPNIVGGGPNQGIPPGPVNPPIIFDVPADMSRGAPEVWLAVSGGDGTTANKYWGGCTIYVSSDDVTYTAIGSVDTPSRMGKITTALAAYAGANPDTVSATHVDLSMSGGELMTVSADDAAAGVSLSRIGSEFLSYENASLTAVNQYDLSDFYRGLHGSAASLHAAGSNFARLDESIFKYPLPQDYIGVPLFFKFQSFNVWGLQIEALEDCVVYDYTPTGQGFFIGAPASCGLTFTAREQEDGTNIIEGTVNVGPSAGPYLDHYDVQVAVDPYTDWVDLPAISAGSTQTSFQPALVTTNYKARTRAVSSAVGGIPSAWVMSGVVDSGGLATAAPAAPTTLVASGGTLSNKLTWDAGSGGGTPQGFKVYAIHGSSGSFGSAVQVGEVAGISSFIHAGLDPSDTWRYWVTAYNFVGETAAAGPDNATTNSGGGGGGGGVWAPLVTGDLPGPVLMADEDGQCIMVEIV